MIDYNDPRERQRFLQEQIRKDRSQQKVASTYSRNSFHNWMLQDPKLVDRLINLFQAISERKPRVRLQIGK